jgi:hypothetical protein
MSIETFAKALAAFQSDIPHVGKDKTATVPTKAGGKYTYDFADLTTITVVALPLLAKHGLSWSARPTLTEAGFVLHYELLHVDGHSVDGDYPLPDPRNTSPQDLGSAITYARRYALTATTGIAPGGEDDDGQKAQESRASHASRPASQQNGNGKSDPVTDARKRVAALGKQLGWTIPQVNEDFASENGGLTIPSASVEQLTSYAENLTARLQSVPS